MYQTLLCTQLLGAENPHCLKSGAFNEQHDEEDGGVLQANRLSLKYNALDFRAPDQTHQAAPSSALEDTIDMGVSLTANSNYSLSGSGGAQPQTYLCSNERQYQRSGLVTDENARVALPVYCGFEEEELLSE